MKLLRIAFFGTLLSGAAVITYAQTKVGDLVADIPFSFVVAGRTLPPGRYVVTHLNENLGIHDAGKVNVFVPAHAEQRPANENTSKVVFHRYDDTYFLAEVWVSGNSTGRALYLSRSERELAARGKQKEREVAVVEAEK